MTIFKQLGRAAKQAEAQGVISVALEERISVFSRHWIDYKHLGLELHRLHAQLIPATQKSPRSALVGIEELVEQIESRCRRL